MNKKNISKIKSSIVVFLVLVVLCSILVIFSRSARAEDHSMMVYYIVTSDTTPLIKGVASAVDAGEIVSIVVGDYDTKETTISGDGSWSFEFDEELPLGDYAVGAAFAIDIDGEIVSFSDGAHIYIEEDYPLDIYYEEEGDELIVSSIIFPNDYTYTSGEDHFSLTFSAGTEVTVTGGGTFNANEWYAEGVDPNNERVILKLRFGVPDIDLTFSQNVSITFDVGEEYDGQTLNIFSRSDGGDDGWEPMDVECDVIGGSCSFETSHASYFAITEYNSIAETEEGENDDDSEKAEINSWKAYQYKNNKGVSCKTRLVLEIKGKHFDKDAEARIGNKKAFSVEKKSSEKLIAKFCMKDLLKVKSGKKRTVSVTNPDTDKEKADKKINLGNIKYKKFKVIDLDPQTAGGIENIQRALISMGLLDEQYVTGIYGPLTTEAVKEFQRQNGIPQTGFVGPLTKAKLEEKLR